MYGSLQLSLGHADCGGASDRVPEARYTSLHASMARRDGGVSQRLSCL